MGCCLLVIQFLLLAVINPLGSCPTFGSEAEQGQNTPQSSSGLLLNFGDTAQCNGTVTAWSYCFHQPTQNRSDPFSAKFIVFRRGQDNNDVYTEVEGSVSTVEFSYDNARTAPFCRRKALTGRTEFKIEQNDVIGACLHSEPLELASQTSDNTRLVYSSQDQDCSEGSLRSIDIMQGFNNKNWILHLSVVISKFW